MKSNIQREKVKLPLPIQTQKMNLLRERGKERTLGPKRKLSLTPLAIHTIRTLSIPKTNPKSNSNPKTKPFSMEPLWVPKGKQKWNIKEGGKVLTTSRDNQ